MFLIMYSKDLNSTSSIEKTQEMIPEFRVIKAYLGTLDFVIGSFRDSMPKNVCTIDFCLRVEDLYKKLLDVHQEFAQMIKLPF